MIKIELAEITDLDRIMKIIEACATNLISKQIFNGVKNTQIERFLKMILKK